MSRACLFLLVVAPLALAQPPREELPPLSPIPPTPEALGGGTQVSRPLQPVGKPDDRATEDPSCDPADSPFDLAGFFAGLFMPDPSAPQFRPPMQAFYRSWLSAELMIGWAKGVQLPPLATSNPVAPPVLGDPNTAVVLGGRRSGFGGYPGGRFTAGRWADPDRTFGAEVGYTLFGTHTDTTAVGGGGPNGTSLLGRPLFNPRAGAEDVVYVAHPLMTGSLRVSESLRVQGWEATGLARLAGDAFFRVHAVGGYRYFQVNEGVRFDQRSEFVRTVGDLAVVHRSASADQIDGHNGFHGGLLGLRAQFDGHGIFLQFDGRVSLGQVTQVVTVSGQTIAARDLPTGPEVVAFPNGVFGQPTNAGRIGRGRFAVLPEAGVRLGGQFGPRWWWHVGYQFTYLSDVVRAADQLDRTVDLTQAIPDPLNLISPATRPRVPFARSDFWVQGVTLGLEWRY